MDIIGRFGLSIRRGCRIIGLSRTSFGYRPKQDAEDEVIRNRLKELAQQRRRFGCARLHVMLRREGLMINHKRTERIYRQEGLSLRIRRRKKMASAARLELPRARRPNERWSMDFMSDNLSSGRRLRLLTIVDDYSRLCHRIEVDTSIGGARITDILNEISLREGLPESITIDNGPEFISKALDAWAYQRGVKLNFIRPGKPVENAYIESFNGKLRDECLNEHWFLNLDHARQLIEEWRIDYNRERPHSSLSNLTPEEFLQQENRKIEFSLTKEAMSHDLVLSTS